MCFSKLTTKMYCRKLPIAKEHQKKPNTLGPCSFPKTEAENVGAITSSPPRQQFRINTVPM